MGNKIDLDTAIELTNMIVTKEDHIPVPTRMADLMNYRIRKEYQSSNSKL